MDQTRLPPSRIDSLACVCVMAACPLLSKFSIPKFQHPRVRAAYTHTLVPLKVDIIIQSEQILFQHVSMTIIYLDV